ncbi:Nucleotidylyl transferase [Ramaria rubella]|nr:Nucleotidylyl transferase [Ramaria rubella]
MGVSLWFDGCFDGFHYAHANAVRQALYLIEGEQNPRILVGVHSDKAILKNKGPPLFDETERYNLIRGCRWIDEVVENVPYVTRFDVTRGHNIDFVVHGDDIVLDAEGNDCYAAFKAAGKYRECKRTEGISTTSLIERIMRPDEWATAPTDDTRLGTLIDLFVASIPHPYPVLRYDRLSSDECCIIRQRWPPQKKIVYLGGSWDCFGAGHVELLRQAKNITEPENTLLVVGVWSDQVLHDRTGGRPLLTLLERALAIIQCKYTDAVILSPPVTLTEQFADSIGIELIVNSDHPSKNKGVQHVHIHEPPLQDIASLREKLLARRELYEERQRRKGA